MCQPLNFPYPKILLSGSNFWKSNNKLVITQLKILRWDLVKDLKWVLIWVHMGSHIGRNEISHLLISDLANEFQLGRGVRFRMRSHMRSCIRSRIASHSRSDMRSHPGSRTLFLLRFYVRPRDFGSDFQLKILEILWQVQNCDLFQTQEH